MAKYIQIIEVMFCKRIQFLSPSQNFNCEVIEQKLRDEEARRINTAVREVKYIFTINFLHTFLRHVEIRNGKNKSVQNGFSIAHKFQFAIRVVCTLCRERDIQLEIKRLETKKMGPINNYFCIYYSLIESVL